MRAKEWSEGIADTPSTACILASSYQDDAAFPLLPGLVQNR